MQLQDQKWDEEKVEKFDKRFGSRNCSEKKSKPSRQWKRTTWFKQMDYDNEVKQDQGFCNKNVPSTSGNNEIWDAKHRQKIARSLKLSFLPTKHLNPLPSMKSYMPPYITFILIFFLIIHLPPHMKLQQLFMIHLTWVVSINSSPFAFTSFIHLCYYLYKIEST